MIKRWRKLAGGSSSTLSLSWTPFWEVTGTIISLSLSLSLCLPLLFFHFLSFSLFSVSVLLSLSFPPPVYLAFLLLFSTVLFLFSLLLSLSVLHFLDFSSPTVSLFSFSYFSSLPFFMSVLHSLCVCVCVCVCAFVYVCPSILLFLYFHSLFLCLFFTLLSHSFRSPFCQDLPFLSSLCPHFVSSFPCPSLSTCLSLSLSLSIS